MSVRKLRSDVTETGTETKPNSLLNVLVFCSLDNFHTVSKCLIKKQDSSKGLHYLIISTQKTNHHHNPVIPCWSCFGPDTRIWHVCSPQSQSRSCPQKKTHLSPYWTLCWQPRLHLSASEQHNSTCSNYTLLWAWTPFDLLQVVQNVWTEKGRLFPYVSVRFAKLG